VIVRGELTALQQLHQLPNVSASLKSGLRQAAISLSAQQASTYGNQNNIVRIDVSKGGKYVVTFFNNLEKDSTYTKRWPKKLKTLLMPSWQLQALARNLYTVVAVVDPLTAGGAYLLQQMQMIWQQQYPVRIGVVPFCGDASKHSQSSGAVYATSANVRVCRLYAYVRETYGVVEASSFLFHLAGTVFSVEQHKDLAATHDQSYSLEETYNVEMLTDVYVTALSNSETVFESTSKLRSDANSLQVGESSKHVTTYKHDDYISNTTAYLSARGLPVNSFSMNGIVIKDTEMNQYLMQLLGREQFIISQYVRNGMLTDKQTTSIFASILELNGERSTFTRYHNILEPSTEAQYVDLFGSSANLKSLLDSVHYHYLLDGVGEDTVDKPLNTTMVIASVTPDGVQSMTSALKWAASQSLPANTHRLAVIPVFASFEQESCVDMLLSEGIGIIEQSGKKVFLSRVDSKLPPSCELLVSTSPTASAWNALRQAIEMQISLFSTVSAGDDTTGSSIELIRQVLCMVGVLL
jgi:hypothetical protein